MSNTVPFFKRHILMAGMLSAGMSLLAVHHELRGMESGSIPPAAKRPVGFVKDIKPLLRDKCHKCHGSSRKEAGLRLDRRDDALNGGDSGAAFVAGKSQESLLIKYVAGVDPDVVMPPEGEKFTDEEIGLLRAWIDQGAKWPEGE
jgi:mono/diheme cytochrome c family protein